MPLVDFAIITGLLEEITYLKSAIKGLEEVSEGGTDAWYYGRFVADNDRAYSVVASFQPDMGPQHAHGLAAEVIRRWDPAYIVVVGIAGSFHHSVQLGHVIVSTQIFFYDPGKATEDGIEYRPEGFPCSATLLRQAQLLSLDKKSLERWQREGRRAALTKAKAARSEQRKRSASQLKAKTKKKSGGRRSSSLKDLISHVPQVHFGTVASGSLVITSKRMQARLLSLHGKIFGTEMEGAGVLSATFRQERPTPSIVIKGISDHADPNKAAADEERYWRALGGENAGRFLRAMLRRGQILPLHTDEFTLDTTKGPTDLTMTAIPDRGSPGVSYLGFPWLVRPRGPVTELHIDVIPADKDGNRLVVRKLVIRYAGTGGKPTSIDRIDPDGPLVLSRLSAEPVGLFVMLAGEATMIRFNVSTAAAKVSADWQGAARERGR